MKRRQARCRRARCRETSEPDAHARPATDAADVRVERLAARDAQGDVRSGELDEGADADMARGVHGEIDAAVITPRLHPFLMRARGHELRRVVGILLTVVDAVEQLL